MYLTADGQDGNTLQIEKRGPIYSSLSPCVLKNSQNHVLFQLLKLT